MVTYLLSSVYLIAGVLVFGGLVAYIFGEGGVSSKGKGWFNSGLTIIILYLVFNAVYCSGNDYRGIPFAGVINEYGSIQAYMKQSVTSFSYDVAQLFTLTLVVALLGEMVPSSLGGSGFDGKILYRIILTIGALIFNHRIVIWAENQPLFQYLVSFIHFFVAGGTLALTPMMLLGNLVAKVTGLTPDNQWVVFLVEKLPETRIGKVIKTSFSSAMVMLFALFSLERIYGSVGNAAAGVSEVLIGIGPLLIMIIGIAIAASIILRLLKL